jgi:solute carrier family 25 S-adenosylmethionine transporter 26
MCGSFAGGIAAAITTSRDVAKTRIMLGESQTSNFITTIFEVHKAQGIKGLFSGVAPRVFWISLGGFVFLGAFEQTRKTLTAAFFIAVKYLLHQNGFI